jgi:hypothetical protein
MALLVQALQQQLRVPERSHGPTRPPNFMCAVLRTDLDVTLKILVWDCYTILIKKLIIANKDSLSFQSYSPKWIKLKA